MMGSQIFHDLYKYVPLRLLETYKPLLVLYEILLLNSDTRITQTTKQNFKNPKTTTSNQ